MKIKTLTGLRIGGPRESIEIGGIDNITIKDPITRLPYIPGSSLKGKLRSLMEKLLNVVDKDGNPIGISVEKSNNNSLQIKVRETTIPLQDQQGRLKKEQVLLYILDEDKLRISNEKDKEILKNTMKIIRMFGNHGNSSIEPRLIIRDFICVEKDLEKVYEIKPENVVNRVSGTAQHPRIMERVRRGVEFRGEIIYKLLGWGELDINKVIAQAEEELSKLKDAIIHLMKYEYLGGSGTRGYGKVAVYITKPNIENNSDNENKEYEEYIHLIDSNENLKKELKKIIEKIIKEINNTAKEEEKKYINQ